MRGPHYFGIGGVVSADIAVPNHGQEVRFYSQVLTTGSAPLWREDLMNNQGAPVIGLGARSPEYDALPLQWMPHIQVADVAASAARALELGGRELFHGKADDGSSQWAVLIDPAGTAFGIIPVVVGDASDSNDLNSVGHIAWLSLNASDVSSTVAFYEQVVGWSSAANDSADRFDMQRPDEGHVAAEICARNDDNRSIPSAWILSLPVDDLAESLRRVRAGGGEIVKDSKEAGRAVIRDPVGVIFALEAKS